MQDRPLRNIISIIIAVVFLGKLRIFSKNGIDVAWALVL